MLTLAMASASMVMSMANLFYTLKKSTDGNDNRFCFMPPMGMPSSTTLHYDPWYDF
jgi:hypothetical protein